MSKKQCACGCCSEQKSVPEYQVGGAELTLADLPVGSAATIVKVMPDLRGKKKFADVGMVAGTELKMESHAPFGGLLRVKIMETSMALHRKDAERIMLKNPEAEC